MTNKPSEAPQVAENCLKTPRELDLEFYRDLILENEEA
jgi:hypothetical protein